MTTVDFAKKEGVTVDKVRRIYTLLASGFDSKEVRIRVNMDGRQHYAKFNRIVNFIIVNQAQKNAVKSVQRIERKYYQTEQEMLIPKYHPHELEGQEAEILKQLQ